MKSDIPLSEQIRSLEELLLIPKIRRSPEELEALLADDFLEFGSSGQTYTKQQIIAALQHESEIEFSLYDFQVRLLAPGVALATFRTVKSGPYLEEPSQSLRSSIWRYINGRWKLTFHQGTQTQASGQ
jgi:hypothetical protein